MAFVKTLSAAGAFSLNRVNTVSAFVFLKFMDFTKSNFSNQAGFFISMWFLCHDVSLVRVLFAR